MRRNWAKPKKLYIKRNVPEKLLSARRKDSKATFVERKNIPRATKTNVNNTIKSINTIKGTKNTPRSRYEVEKKSVQESTKSCIVRKTTLKDTKNVAKTEKQSIDKEAKVEQEEKTFFTRKYVQKRHFIVDDHKTPIKSNKSNDYYKVNLRSTDKNYCMKKTNGTQVEYCNFRCQKVAISVIRKPVKTKKDACTVDEALKSLCGSQPAPQWCLDKLGDIEVNNVPEKELKTVLEDPVFTQEEKKSFGQHRVLETIILIFAFPVLYVVVIFIYFWHAQLENTVLQSSAQ